MELLKKKPTTPSQRNQLLLDRVDIKKIKILKNKSCFIKNRAGRNNKGRITSFNRGGGHKKRYRILSPYSFLSGIVESIEYDPYRSANIARIFIENNEAKNLILYIFIFWLRKV